MKHSLIIGELNYLDDVTDLTLVGGSVPVAITEVITKAEPGFAGAGASALASGDYVALGTQTKVTTGKNFGFANAAAIAKAVSGNSSAISFDFGNSSAVKSTNSLSSNVRSVSFSVTNTQTNN